MRRFSQRNSLVTLNDINITPLLDLAFVLLIIFVITRPLLEQSMDLKLPEVGQQANRNQIDQKDIRMVEISPSGEYKLAGKRMDLRQLEADLVKTFQQNPKMVVYIRGDKRTEWDHVAKVLSLCLKNGITRVSPQTAPVK